MDSWFSDQGDRTFLSESNGMLQEVFLANYEKIPVKKRYRLKQEFFYQLSKKILFPKRLKKNKDFQLEEGQDLIQEKIIPESCFWNKEFRGTKNFSSPQR